MSTATKQTSPAFTTSEGEVRPPEAQSTLGVVQKLQQKLRSTRENLERLRLDPSAEGETAPPHLISDKIANQLRLVNQERIEVLQQLGATGNEKLKDVVSRMQLELEDLRRENEQLQSRPRESAASMPESMSADSEEQGFAEPFADDTTEEELVLEESESVSPSEMSNKIADETRPAPMSANSPSPEFTPPQGVVPRPHTVLEQETRRRGLDSEPESAPSNGQKQASASEQFSHEFDNDVMPEVKPIPIQSGLGSRPVPLEPTAGIAYDHQSESDESPVRQLDDLLAMLEANTVEEGFDKLEEMRDLCEKFPEQRESLVSRNQELTRAVKKMHADQIALCKRFNVDSLSDMAKLIMETMEIKKQSAVSAPEMNSWTAIADLLQDWDKKIPVSDPNHTVKVERTGSRWNLSANWLQK